VENDIEQFDFMVQEGRIYIRIPGKNWESPCLMNCLMSIYRQLPEYRHLQPSLLLDVLGVNDPRGPRYDKESVLQKMRAGEYDDDI